MTETVCSDHSGIRVRLSALEDDTKNLFKKWDGIQKLLITTLISAILSLLGVIILIMRS